MRPALQPMPERLYVTMLGRIRKWFTTMDASDGVGLKSEQFTIKISTCIQSEDIDSVSKRKVVESRASVFSPDDT